MATREPRRWERLPGPPADPCGSEPLTLEQSLAQLEAARTRAAWLDATVSATSDLVSAEDPFTALGALCARAREVAAADLSWVEVTDRCARTHTSVSSAGGRIEGDDDPRLPAPHRALADRVARLATPARTDGSRGERLVVVPLATRSGVIGTLGLAWSPGRRGGYDRLPTDLPAGLARQAALVLEVAEARRTLRDAVAVEERHRIARDLHDLTLQRLFAVELGMESVGHRVQDPGQTRRLGSLAEQLQDAIVEMRRTIFWLGRPDRAEDPAAAVRAVLERAAGVLKLRPSLRLSGPLEDLDPALTSDLVAVLAESLSNVARHACAGAVLVDVRVEDALTVVVRDDGVGLPRRPRAGGLRNLQERAAAHGGHCTVGADPRGGTRVTWRVPLAAGATSLRTDHRARAG